MDINDQLGTDLSCLDDIDATFKTVSGVTLLAQALYRRLTTPNGSLFYDDDYGFDLHDFINATIDSELLQRIRSGIVYELQKDERVGGVNCRVTASGDDAINIVIEVSSSVGKPFKMIISIDSMGVSLPTIS